MAQERGSTMAEYGDFWEREEREEVLQPKTFVGGWAAFQNGFGLEVCSTRMARAGWSAAKEDWEDMVRWEQEELEQSQWEEEEAVRTHGSPSQLELFEDYLDSAVWSR